MTGGRALPEEVVKELQHRYATDWLAGDAGCGASAADEVDDDGRVGCWSRCWARARFM